MSDFLGGDDTITKLLKGEGLAVGSAQLFLMVQPRATDSHCL